MNLLQPQDRRSRAAGDSREAVEARARLLANGIGAGILGAFVLHAAELLPGGAAVVADLGCGSGDALGALDVRRTVTGIGVDLSAFAITAAARRFPALTWIVANGDRRLPLIDASVSLVLTLHARRNRDECRRVLLPGGHLLIAVPSRDDLIELREAVQGARVERDRAADAIAEHQPDFELVDRTSARECHELGGPELRDVLRGTYRGERASAAARVHELEHLRVTFASDFIVLRRRETPAAPRPST